MRLFEKTFFSLAVLLLSCVAWGAIAFLAFQVSDAEASRVVDSGIEKNQAAQLNTALRVRTLARETKEDRDLLNALAHTEVITMVETIEEAGRFAQATLEIVEVLPGSVVPSASPDVPTVRKVEVFVESKGAFSPLFRSATLLSELPLSSMISSMRLSRLPDTEDGSWRLNIRLQILTIADISS